MAMALQPSLAAFLERRLRPAPDYPCNEVVSLYYDTPHWDSLAAKLNSDYLKLKFRLRYYRSPGNGATSPVYAEVKTKIGSRRGKVRIQLDLTASELEGTPLEDPALLELPRLAAGRLGVVLPARLAPTFTVEYQRLRFVEPATRTQVCVDHRIRAGRVHRQRLSHARPGALPHAVLEQKGEEPSLIAALEPIIGLGLRRESYSKYARIYTHLTGHAA